MRNGDTGERGGNGGVKAVRRCAWFIYHPNNPNQLVNYSQHVHTNMAHVTGALTSDLIISTFDLLITGSPPIVSFTYRNTLDAVSGLSVTRINAFPSCFFYNLGQLQISLLLHVRVDADGVSRAVETEREYAMPLPPRPSLGGKHGLDVAGSLEGRVATLVDPFLLAANVLL